MDDFTLTAAYVAFVIFGMPVAIWLFLILMAEPRHGGEAASLKRRCLCIGTGITFYWVAVVALGFGGPTWLLPGGKVQTNANTKPRHVVPGSVVRLQFDEVESIAGYWRCGDLDLTASAGGGDRSAQQKFILGSLNSRDASWGDSILLQTKGEPEAARQHVRTTSSPIWVEFHLPDDPAIEETECSATVRMRITYPTPAGSSPFTESPTFRNTSRVIDKTVQFYIGSDRERSIIELSREYALWWYVPAAIFCLPVVMLMLVGLWNED